MIVEYDDLYYDNGLFLRDGDLFTGTAVQHDERGHKIFEVPIEQGFYEGVARAWYPEGTLKFETRYRKGVIVGVEREWYASGAIKQESTFECGLAVKATEWDESGAVTKTFEVVPGSGLHKLLEARRLKARSNDSDSGL